MPHGWEFSLVTGDTKVAQIGPIIERWDQRISLSILADMALIGHARSGSFALIHSKVRMFSGLIEHFGNSFTEVFNQDLIPRLMELNLVPQKYWPTMSFGAVESVDLKTLAQFLRDTTGSQVLNPDADLEAHVREIADFPDKLDEEEEVAPVVEPEPEEIAEIA